MGVAALVLGIISIIVGFIPFCGAIAFLPALIGVILGIVDIVKKSKNKESKGMAIAGTILSSAAIVIIAGWTVFAGIIAGSASQNIIDGAEEISKSYNQVMQNSYKELQESLENTDWNY